MKKVIAIFFIFSFLSANTALGEFLKLPLLIHHYIEHNQDNNSHSFLDFLTMHYRADDNHHHNDSEHEHLPLKQSIPLYKMLILFLYFLIFPANWLKIN